MPWVESSTIHCLGVTAIVNFEGDESRLMPHDVLDARQRRQLQSLVEDGVSE